MRIVISYTDAAKWNHHPSWEQFFEPVLPAVEQCLDTVIHGWVSVLLTHDDHMQSLNARYRAHNKPTNVLAFPNHTGNEHITLTREAPCLGDVVLSYETIRREAQGSNVLFQAHVMHMMVHGILHLLGFQHNRPPQAAEMEGYESLVMMQLGYTDPYSYPVKN